MGLLFKTRDESSVEVDITGVGLLPANGQGGISVERAAVTMPELQKDGEPLADKELKEAAAVLAAARGFEMVEVAKKKIEEAEEQDEGALPSVLEASHRAYVDVYGENAPPEASGVSEEEDQPDNQPKAAPTSTTETKREEK